MSLLEVILSLDTAKPTQPGVTHSGEPHKVLLKVLVFAFGMHCITPRVCDAPARGKRTFQTFPYKEIPSLHTTVLKIRSIYSSIPKKSIGHSFLWQMVLPFHFDYASETIFFACIGKQMNKVPIPHSSLLSHF